MNVADPGDPFTILPPFKDYFPEGDLDVAQSIAPFEFHRARNYLKCSPVAATVALISELDRRGR